MARDTKGTHGGWSSSSVKRTQWRREGADIVPTGTLHVTDDIHSHRPQTRDSDRRLDVPILLLERRPNQTFRLLQGEAGNIQGASVGQQNATITIDNTADALGHPAPHVDREGIARSDNIVRAQRHIEWGVATRTSTSHCGHTPVHKNLGTEPFQ